MIHSGISWAFASAVILGLLTTASADPTGTVAPEIQGGNATVRSANHLDFGRIVVDTNGQTAYQLDQDGDHVVVRFGDDVILAPPPPAPRNVIAISTDGPIVDLTLKHGVKLRPMRLDGRVVLDILDAQDTASPARGSQSPGSRPHPPLSTTSPERGGRAAVGAAAPPNSSTAERPPVSGQSLSPSPSVGSIHAQSTVPQPSSGQTPAGQTPAGPTPAGQTPAGPTPAGQTPAGQSSSGEPGSGRSTVQQARTDPPTIEAAQRTPPGRDTLPEVEGPIRLLARRVKLPVGVDGTAFLVPFDGTTGAASFRSGDSTYVVFDERRPVDMIALRSDPVFGAASVQLLPNGTLFRVPLAPPRSIVLTQMQQGWRIAALPAAPKQQPIAVSYTDGRLNLAAEQPGDVISIADPGTGATLLVGTQHRPGQALVSNQRSTEFILRPTIQGVAVEPLSDAIALKQMPTGFSLAGGLAGLLLSPPTSATEGLMDAALLTRRLEFSTMATDALLRRVNKQFGDAAVSPPLGRGVKNRIAAESLIALGLGAEAESLLQMAAEQDPKEAASADTGALTAIAALLAGRTTEADALMDPRLDGTDEISLWRAIRQAMQDDGSPSAAAVFAATAPLVFQYPRPIREHVLPLIVETMIKGGELAPAARLLDQRKKDRRLAYARALMQQAEGNTDEALTMLDTLASGRDQFDRARAAIRAVELRLDTRKLDKVQAADALDKLLYAWRGDAQELALRERVADLRGQTGAWRVALATLRLAEVDFPEQATPIHQRLKEMFAGMIRDQSAQQMPPIDFVSAMDENADLMRDFGDDEAVQQSLADRLLALDLPDRAKPVLEKLMRSAKSDVAKARFGLGLATLEARDGNDAVAKAILDGSDGHDLPPDLAEQRLILRAATIARLGDPGAAAAMLVPSRTARATEARAQILENVADWAGAAQAWSDCATLTVPQTGMLDEGQMRTVLRLATATARAGDDAALADLRQKYGGRIGPGPLGDMFRLLIAEPIRTTADIKRSAREANLAASLPTDLKALQAGAVAR
jgi:tetratricopeptide (TPR) repeat protein